MKFNNITNNQQPSIIMGNGDELMIMTDSASLEIVSTIANMEKFSKIVGEEFEIFGSMTFPKPGYSITDVAIKDIPIEWKVVATETKNKVGIFRRDAVCTYIRDIVIWLDKKNSNKNFFSTEKSVNVVLILRKNK